jgi:uncharacterized membrane protein YesL
MEMNGFMARVYQFCEWVMRLAYVNILWIVFTLAGLVLFGFMPATAAMFAVTRKWIMGQVHIPVFKTFWENYKKDFIKVNALGLFVAILGVILYLDLRFIGEIFEGFWYYVSFYGLISILLMYILVLLYIFPVYVHYKLGFFSYIKYAFLIGISNPGLSILMVLGTAGVYVMLMFLPGLLPFLSVSLVAFICMRAAFSAFAKIDRRSQAMLAKDLSHPDDN